jgi:hypothetical protein
MRKYKPIIKLNRLIAAALIGILAVGCKWNKTSAAAGSAGSTMDSATLVTAKKAPEWAAMLKHSSGWIGADGIYALPLDGNESPGRRSSTKTMFWFSDCIYGTIDHDTLKSGWGMGHNSVAYFTGGEPDPNKIKFYHGSDSSGNASSMFTPNTPLTKPGDYYWLGSGVFDNAKDSTIYIIAYRIRNVPGLVFPFKEVGTSLIALPKGSRPPFKNQRQLDAPLYLKDAAMQIGFGTCMLANTVGAHAPHPDGYIYIYGVKNPGDQLVVARVKDTDIEDFSKWAYWNGSTWGSDVNKCAAVTSGVSNEMSVSYMDDGSGRVIAVYQKSSTSSIFVSVGDTPQGPFYPEKKVWDTPETYDDIDFYTYNAKAYPFLSNPHELLISYNVNAFDFGRKIVIHPYHLRPRFITVKY